MVVEQRTDQLFTLKAFRLRELIACGLIGFFLVFGFTAAAEVFQPVSETADTIHLHAGQNGPVLCGEWISPAGHWCVHSTLIIPAVLPITLQVSLSTAVLDSLDRESESRPAFTDYRLRAPPSRLPA